MQFLSEEDFFVGSGHLYHQQQHKTNEGGLLFLPISVGNDDKGNDVVYQAHEIGRPILNALQQVENSENAEVALRALLNVRSKFHRLGGLSTVRDVLDQTVFLQALNWARQTRTNEAFRVARALSLERLAIRPSSPQTWFWHAQLLGEMGDQNAADNANTRAMDLGLGQGGQFAT